MTRRTNADRAAAASLAFSMSPHVTQNNETLVNLYDLICDLAHLADLIAKQDPDEARACGWGDGDETAGMFVHRMGEWHYGEELAEEAADD